MESLGIKKLFLCRRCGLVGSKDTWFLTHCINYKTVESQKILNLHVEILCDLIHNMNCILTLELQKIQSVHDCVHHLWIICYLTHNMNYKCNIEIRKNTDCYSFVVQLLFSLEFYWYFVILIWDTRVCSSEDFGNDNREFRLSNQIYFGANWWPSKWVRCKFIITSL